MTARRTSPTGSGSRRRPRNPNTFLYNTGPIDTLERPDWNVRQTYSVTRISDGQLEGARHGHPRSRRSTSGRARRPTTTRLADAAVADLDGERRSSPASATIRSTSTSGRSSTSLACGRSTRSTPSRSRTTTGVDGVGGYNTHSIVAPGPDQALDAGPRSCTPLTIPKAVIGVYATASRQQVRDLPGDGGDVGTSETWVQISRLGKPLINEVIIPRGKKDLWNSTDPADDCPVPALLPLAGGRRSSRTRSTSLSTTPTSGPRRPRRDPAHGRARAELHRADEGRPAPPEHRHPADGGRRRRQPARRPGRRPRRVPERPPARGRRRRHRPARVRGGLRQPS